MGGRQHRRVRGRSRRGDHRGGVGGRHVGRATTSSPPVRRACSSAAIIEEGGQAQYGLPAAERASLMRPRRGAAIRPRRRSVFARRRRTSRAEGAVLSAGIGTEQLSGPVTGTKTLPVDPMTGAAEGRAARVPVVIGTTADEFNLFTALQYVRGRAIDAAHFQELLSEAFGPDADAVAHRYPPERFGGSVPLAYSAATTDGVFACVADRLADALSEAGPVYSYVFDDASAPAPEPLREAPFPVGAGHSLELRYLFDVGGAPPLNPDQQRLSEEMMDYWSRFVATGRPGSDWPALNEGDEDGRMSLQPGGNRRHHQFRASPRVPVLGGPERLGPCRRRYAPKRTNG